ncbi:unnamed protein product [Caenorhabditis sp. 36 PRJEB53466]|nr:unnamed protein product [Caenorhabditis sp. 36 PRJEB53466]
MNCIAVDLEIVRKNKKNNEVKNVEVRLDQSEKRVEFKAQHSVLSYHMRQLAPKKVNLSGPQCRTQKQTILIELDAKNKMNDGDVQLKLQFQPPNSFLVDSFVIAINQMLDEVLHGKKNTSTPLGNAIKAMLYKKNVQPQPHYISFETPFRPASPGATSPASHPLRRPLVPYEKARPASKTAGNGVNSSILNYFNPSPIQKPSTSATSEQKTSESASSDVSATPTTDVTSSKVSDVKPVQKTIPNSLQMNGKEEVTIILSIVDKNGRHVNHNMVKVDVDFVAHVIRFEGSDGFHQEYGREEIGQMGHYKPRTVDQSTIVLKFKPENQRGIREILLIVKPADRNEQLLNRLLQLIGPTSESVGSAPSTPKQPATSYVQRDSPAVPGAPEKPVAAAQLNVIDRRGDILNYKEVGVFFDANRHFIRFVGPNGLVLKYSKNEIERKKVSDPIKFMSLGQSTVIIELTPACSGRELHISFKPPFLDAAERIVEFVNDMIDPFEGSTPEAKLESSLMSVKLGSKPLPEQKIASIYTADETKPACTSSLPLRIDPTGIPQKSESLDVTSSRSVQPHSAQKAMSSEDITSNPSVTSPSGLCRVMPEMWTSPTASGASYCTTPSRSTPYPQVLQQTPVSRPRSIIQRVPFSEGAASTPSIMNRATLVGNLNHQQLNQNSVYSVPTQIPPSFPKTIPAAAASARVRYSMKRPADQSTSAQRPVHPSKLISFQQFQSISGLQKTDSNHQMVVRPTYRDAPSGIPYLQMLRASPMTGIQVDAFIVRKDNSTLCFKNHRFQMNSVKQSVQILNSGGVTQEYHILQFQRKQLTKPRVNLVNRIELSLDLNRNDPKNDGDLQVRLSFQQNQLKIVESIVRRFNAMLENNSDEMISNIYQTLKPQAVRARLPAGQQSPPAKKACFEVDVSPFADSKDSNNVEVSIVRKDGRMTTLFKQEIQIDKEKKCIRFKGFHGQHEFHVGQFRKDSVTVAPTDPPGALVVSIDLDESQKENDEEAQLRVAMADPKAQNDVMVDLVYITKGGVLVNHKCRRLTFDKDEHCLVFRSPSDSVTKFCVTQFVLQKIKVPTIVSEKYMILSLKLDRDHPDNHGAKQLKMKFEPPHTNMVEYVAKEFCDMLKANKDKLIRKSRAEKSKDSRSLLHKDRSSFTRPTTTSVNNNEVVSESSASNTSETGAHLKVIFSRTDNASVAKFVHDFNEMHG